MKDSENFYKELRSIIEQQAKSLDAIINDLVPPGEKDADKIEATVRCVIWMLQAIGVSIHSVLRLTEQRDMAIRDCFGIARSAAETAVNAAYIFVSGPKVAELAIRHGRQKRWRDLHREAVIGRDLSVSIRREVDLDISEIPGLSEDLEAFTTKKGGEVREWTSLKIQDRIEVVHKHSSSASILLGAAIFAIYRPSSELLHGTFYGVNYFWQGSRESVARSKDEFDKIWIEDHFVTLASTLIFAASGAIEAVSNVKGWPAHIARQQAIRRLLEQLCSSRASEADNAYSFSVSSSGS